MPERTLRTLLGALRPSNLMMENSGCSCPHDSLRIHFLELEFGTAFPRSTSGVQMVSEGNHPLLPLKLLTSADIGVRVSAVWLEHKGRFLSTNRDAESSQAHHHAVRVVWLRLLLPLRLLCRGILCECGTWRSFTASTWVRRFSRL